MIGQPYGASIEEDIYINIQLWSLKQFHTFYVTFNNKVQSHNVADVVFSTLFTAHFKNIIFIVECVFTVQFDFEHTNAIYLW